jgi:hypothetical protein
MNIIQVFFLTITPSILFLILMEQIGFFVTKVIQTMTKSVDTANQGFVLRVFVGLLVWTMLLLAMGSLNILFSDLVKYGLIVIGLVIFILFRRYKQTNLGKIKLFFLTNRYILLGVLIFFAIGSITAFRPITEFDSLWYHITTPKIFLQDHNTAFKGGGIFRYSVHPFINFFISIWPLTLPLPTVYTSMIINWIQFLIVALGAFWTTQLGKKQFGFNTTMQIATPSLLGLNATAIFLYGTGYNDIYGMIFGLVASLYIFSLSTQKKVSLTSVWIAIMLIVCLMLVKVFFIIHGIFLCIYLLSVVQKAHKTDNTNPSIKQLFLVFGIGFVVFILPWLIRSYFYTGKLLYPIGDKGVEVDTYINAGSVDANNHWSSFIWQRFDNSLVLLLLFSYSPLFLLGIFSLINSSISKKIIELWVYSFVSFWVVFFISIYYDPRYLFGSASVFVFLGIVIFSELSRKLTAITMLALLLLPTGYIYLSYRYVNAQSRNWLKGYLIPSLKTGITPIEVLVTAFKANQEYAYTPDYKSDYFELPDGIKKTDIIFIINNVHLAYFDFKVIHPYTEPSIYTSNKLKTASDFYAALKKDGVNYIYANNQSISDQCKLLKINDYENCDKSDYVEITLKDKPENITWYKLK